VLEFFSTSYFAFWSQSTLKILFIYLLFILFYLILFLIDYISRIGTRILRDITKHGKDGKREMTTSLKIFVLVTLIYGLASSTSQLQTLYFHLKVPIN